VEYEIETRLRFLRKEQPFAGIHICPSSSLDVPDDQTARLVVLRPTDEYKTFNQKNTAMTAVTDIFNNRGNAPRIYRNMLAFIAPDQDLMTSLKQAVRLFLAWKSIKEDSEDLNLDAAQNRDTDNNLHRSNETVEARIKEAYCWLLVPYIDKATDMKTIVWDTISISGGNDSIISKAAKKMLQNEQIITAWAPALLLMELDHVLWKDTDNIAIKKLWEYLCTYCYLPRLAGDVVLDKAIQTGLNSDQYFAFASGFDGTRYKDLKFNQYIGIVERSGYLVKVSVAQKQLADDEAKRQAETAARAAEAGAAIPASTSGGDSSTTYQPYTPGDVALGGTHEVREGGTPDTHPAASKNRRFFMSVDLDTTRINRDVQKCVEEIIQHLTNVDGTTVKVSLEVEAETDEGFSRQTVRTISENCRTLKVRDSGFEE
jgi:copper chaperone CopZ